MKLSGTLGMASRNAVPPLCEIEESTTRRVSCLARKGFPPERKRGRARSKARRRPALINQGPTDARGAVGGFDDGARRTAKDGRSWLLLAGRRKKIWFAKFRKISAWDILQAFRWGVEFNEATPFAVSKGISTPFGGAAVRGLPLSDAERRRF